MNNKIIFTSAILFGLVGCQTVSTSTNLGRQNATNKQLVIVENCFVEDPNIRGLYKGDCPLGIANGYGVAKGNYSYDGYFLNGKKHGVGVYKWSNGSKYEGDFSDDRMHGKGVFIGAGGNKYEGEYVNNLKEGRGSYTYADGRVNTGYFLGDKFIEKKHIPSSPLNSKDSAATGTAVSFVVKNSFTQEEIIKRKGLASRGKSSYKDMKINIRATMNNRPLDGDYKVKVETRRIVDYKCTAKRKTSMQIKGCNSTEKSNKKIGVNEIVLTRKNNWSSTFSIDSNVEVFGVLENWVARYELEILKLKIEPKVISIEAIK